MTVKRLYHPGSYLLSYDSSGDKVTIDRLVTDSPTEIDEKVNKIMDKYETEIYCLTFKLTENIKCDQYTLGSLVIHYYEGIIEDKLEDTDLSKSYMLHILEAIDLDSIAEV